MSHPVHQPSNVIDFPDHSGSMSRYARAQARAAQQQQQDERSRMRGQLSLVLDTDEVAPLPPARAARSRLVLTTRGAWVVSIAVALVIFPVARWWLTAFSFVVSS